MAHLTTSSVTNDQSHPREFFDLPPEVHYMIFEHVYVDHDIVLRGKDRYCKAARAPSFARRATLCELVLPKILQREQLLVSKRYSTIAESSARQMSHSGTFYRTTTFVFTDAELLKALLTRGCAHVELLTRVRLDLAALYLQHSETLETCLKLLATRCRRLKILHLDNMHLTLISPHDIFIPLCQEMLVSSFHKLRWANILRSDMDLESIRLDTFARDWLRNWGACLGRNLIRLEYYMSPKMQERRERWAIPTVNGRDEVRATSTGAHEADS